jgi:acetyl esterase/lipase
VIDIKEAIRFLRARAKELGLDGERFAVMGESAGGYLSAITGVLGLQREYDTGEYLEQSSAVKAIVSWYPATEPSTFACSDPVAEMLPKDFKNYPDITKIINKDTPPCFILHGTADTTVDISQSEKLSEALQAKHIESDFAIIEGAEHADTPFVQPEVKQMILDFINKHIGN